MHSKADSQVPFVNFERIMEDAPSHVETWARDGDNHMFVQDFLAPENDSDYAWRILSFLERHFP